MAKQAAAKHVFSVSAPVNAAPAHVFDALSCASNFEALFSAVQDLSPQASGGFGGRASALFLREDVTLKVVLTQVTLVLAGTRLHGPRQEVGLPVPAGMTTSPLLQRGVPTHLCMP